MLAAPSRDWSVFQQIFADHWDTFQRVHPRYQTSYYDSLVAKMLACGNPEKSGYIEYRCHHCGQGTHVVAMSCKSSLCLRCAKVYVDNWVSQVSHMLHEGVLYRHIILTVPAMFNTAQCCSTRGSRRYRRHAQHNMSSITPGAPIERRGSQASDAPGGEKGRDVLGCRVGEIRGQHRVAVWRQGAHEPCQGERNGAQGGRGIALRSELGEIPEDTVLIQRTEGREGRLILHRDRTIHSAIS